VSYIIFGDNDQSACLLVEAMYDTGTKFAADARELIEVVQQRVDQGSVVAFVCLLPRSRHTCACMHHHAGGFIDDGEELVLVNDAEGDVLRKSVQRRWVRSAFDRNLFSTLELHLCLCGLAIYAYLTMIDEKLNARPADVSYRLSEILIKP
jgi:hypothetical protein